MVKVPVVRRAVLKRAVALVLAVADPGDRLKELLDHHDFFAGEEPPAPMLFLGPLVLLSQEVEGHDAAETERLVHPAQQLVLLALAHEEEHVDADHQVEVVELRRRLSADLEELLRSPLFIDDVLAPQLQKRIMLLRVDREHHIETMFAEVAGIAPVAGTQIKRQMALLFMHLLDCERRERVGLVAHPLMFGKGNDFAPRNCCLYHAKIS